MNRPHSTNQSVPNLYDQNCLSLSENMIDFIRRIQITTFNLLVSYLNWIFFLLFSLSILTWTLWKNVQVHPVVRTWWTEKCRSKTHFNGQNTSVFNIDFSDENNCNRFILKTVPENFWIFVFNFSILNPFQYFHIPHWVRKSKNE